MTFKETLDQVDASIPSLKTALGKLKPISLKRFIKETELQVTLPDEDHELFNLVADNQDLSLKDTVDVIRTYADNIYPDSSYYLIHTNGFNSFQYKNLEDKVKNYLISLCGFLGGSFNKEFYDYTKLLQTLLDAHILTITAIEDSKQVNLLIGLNLTGNYTVDELLDITTKLAKGELKLDDPLLNTKLLYETKVVAYQARNLSVLQMYAPQQAKLIRERSVYTSLIAQAMQNSKAPTLYVEQIGSKLLNN